MRQCFFALLHFLGRASSPNIAHPLPPSALEASALTACIVASFFAALAAMVCIFTAMPCSPCSDGLHLYRDALHLLCNGSHFFRKGLHRLALWRRSFRPPPLGESPDPLCDARAHLCPLAYPLALRGFSMSLIFMGATLLMPFFPSPSLAVPFPRFIWLGRLTSDLLARALDV